MKKKINSFCPHRIYNHRENQIGLTHNYNAIMTLIKACINYNRGEGNKECLGEL